MRFFLNPYRWCRFAQPPATVLPSLRLDSIFSHLFPFPDARKGIVESPHPSPVASVAPWRETVPTSERSCTDSLVASAHLNSASAPLMEGKRTKYNFTDRVVPKYNSQPSRGSQYLLGRFSCPGGTAESSPAIYRRVKEKGRGVPEGRLKGLNLFGDAIQPSLRDGLRPKGIPAINRRATFDRPSGTYERRTFRSLNPFYQICLRPTPKAFLFFPSVGGLSATWERGTRERRRPRVYPTQNLRGVSISQNDVPHFFCDLCVLSRLI